MTKSLIARLNARYGDDWFTYQPPGARPIRVTENLGMPDAATSTYCPIKVKAAEVFVLTSYSLKLTVNVPNPNWVGEWVIALPEYSLQGRLRWQPVVNKQPLYEIYSIVDGFVYIWNPPAPQVLPKHDGFSLLKEYRHPRVLINPGQTAEIQVSYMDQNAGIDPIDNTEGVFNLIAEISGYFLTIPQGQKEIEIYEERVREHAGTFIEMLAKRLGPALLR
jgi:hypothetical protein